jgi:hypothetical protein
MKIKRIQRNMAKTENRRMLKAAELFYNYLYEKDLTEDYQEYCKKKNDAKD